MNEAGENDQLYSSQKQKQKNHQPGLHLHSCSSHEDWQDTRLDRRRLLDGLWNDIRLVDTRNQKYLWIQTAAIDEIDYACHCPFPAEWTVK